MKIEEFNDINQLFNTLTTDLDLEETMTVVDAESILSRIYKKVDNEIDSGILGCLLLFNKHIRNEQYDSAQKMKEYIQEIY